MAEITEKRYYRPDELAKEMCVSRETVLRWLRKDLVKHVHFPKGIYIPREEFLWILQHGPRQGPM